MRRGGSLLLILAGLALFAAGAGAEESGAWEAAYRDRPIARLTQSFQDLFRGKPRLYWSRGPVFETEKKAFALHIGYEGQFDATWHGGMEDVVEDAAGAKWQSGFDVRRSRVGFEAFALRDFFIRVRYGWTGLDKPEFQDLFVEWSGLTHIKGEWWPVIRVGQVKEAMTIDWMNNALRTTFAERAMFTTSVVPNRNPGVRLHGTGFGKRLSYQVGGYLVDAANLSERADGEGESVTARVTGLPWAPDKDDKRLLHLGIAASWRFDIESLRIASTPESLKGPSIVDTGSHPADSARVLVGEFFYKNDRFSLCAEGGWRRVKWSSGQDSDYWGAYATASYFLTPPGLPYNRTLACFGRVRPECQLFCPARRGMGAWEVAARYSILDLDSGPHRGGTAWTVTLGVNWYARDNIRLLFNYIYADVDDAYGVRGADGTMNTLLVRLAYDL